jgi:hypothetical protein
MYINEYFPPETAGMLQVESKWYDLCCGAEELQNRDLEGPGLQSISLSRGKLH